MRDEGREDDRRRTMDEGRGRMTEDGRARGQRVIDSLSKFSYIFKSKKCRTNWHNVEHKDS